MSDPSTFEKALNVWALIDLPGLQKKLDEHGMEFQSYQKESLVGRKELASKTKSFKKLGDEEKLGEFNSLLRAYQKEIDDLAKKNKNVDNVFFQIYRAIAEAPDPKPLLEMSVDAVNSAADIERLRAEKSQLEEKLVERADYEQLKQQLETQEEELTRSADAAVQAKEDEWRSLLEEKQDNWDERRRELETMLATVQKQVEELKVNEEVMQKRLANSGAGAVGADDDADDIDLDSPDEGMRHRAATSVEVEILTRDVESSKLRILELEKRNEELRKDLAGAKSNIEGSKVLQDSRKKASDMESENAVLVARLEQERERLDALEKEKEQQKEASQRTQKQLNQELDALKEYKNDTRDYEEIKQELDMIREIQFGGDFEASTDGAGEDGQGQLESAIIQRNKKLNNELIEYRSKNADLGKLVSDLEQELAKSRADLEQSHQLSAKLENDLENVESSAEKWETMSMISSVAPSSVAASHNGRISPATSIAGGSFDTRSLAPTSAQDSSILPIITQQRDRFRRRNKELEEESKKNFSKIVELKRDVQTLKADNRDLYEKMRFMEYQRTQAPQLMQQAAGTDVESRYRETYESELHPIEKFRKLESTRISSRLSPFERVFIQVTKLVLATPLTRWLFVFYCFGLHVLVAFLMITLAGEAAVPPVTDAVLGDTGGVN